MSPALLKLGSIIVIGIGCQLLADRLGLPSILVLLIGGFVAGPLTGFLNPDQLLGDFLFPIVSLAVGLILFEGGLRLRLSNFQDSRKAILSLTTVGIVLTASMSAFLGWWLLNFQPDVALLFGTITIITGPTVIIPLFREIDLKRPTRTVAIWEGIINDPVGSILTVFVYELIVVHHPPGVILLDGAHKLVLTVGVGIGIALGGSLIVKESLERDWISSHLKNPAILASVLFVFLLAEAFQPESGLIATPLMGFVLANSTDESLQAVLRFKEEIAVVLLSALFIILTARFDLAGFYEIGLQSVVVLGLLIFVVRPLSVLLSILPTDLSWREITALSFFAPRGIIAAVIASLFALKLKKLGYPKASHLDAEVFFIIAGTVVFYGLLAPPLFRSLKLVEN